MENEVLYLAPNNAETSSYLVSHDEAIALKLFCEQHGEIHVDWGKITVCRSCKIALYAREEGEWVKYGKRFDRLIREFCSTWVIELLDGHFTEHSKQFWLDDILTTICVVHKKKPAEVLGNFADYTDFMEKAFSGPL